MECNLDGALLQDLLEGTLDPLEKLIVEEHLKTCRKCRKEVNEWKLLFWDLNDKTNYELALPAGLNQIKNSLLGEFTAAPANKPAKSTTAKILGIGRQNARAVGMFLDYLPGIKTGNELVKKGVRAAPSAIGKASKALAKRRLS